MLLNWQHLPFQGDYKHIPKSENDRPADEYEVLALAVRNGITREQMLDMSVVSLLNILISMTNDEEVEHKATQSDIDRMFG